MEKLDAKTRPVGTLFSQEFFFRIPEYQRPFSWDSDHFEDLVDDVTSANKAQDYFLGTIVLHQREDLALYDIVDGQQRLTSIMILLACLRDLVNEEDYKSGIQAKLMQNKNVVDGIPEKTRLEVRDRKVFNDIVVTKGGTVAVIEDEQQPEPEWRYYRAVSVFRSKLDKLSQDELKAVITFINQKCVLIYLATPTFDDAFRLFTIVNDRGKQLRRIDILKALNIAPDVITSDTVRKRLAQQWEEVEKELGSATFESVFYLVRLILLRDKPQADLLKEFEDRVFAKALVVKGEAFFTLIFEYSALYANIFVDRDFVPESNTDYKKWRALIHIMNSEFEASEWRACLIAFARRFRSEKLYQFCLEIEKVYLEQWVLGVRKDERFAVYAEILALIASSKKPDDVFSMIKYNKEAIKTATTQKDVYSKGFGKYLLLRLELVTAEHDGVREFNAKSVEHVLPQKPEPDSEWASKHDLAVIEEYVNSVGNLVLLSKSKNSSASNFDFTKKKEKYLGARVTDYPRSVQVLGYQDWLRETIETRTRQAADLILSNP